MVKDNTSCREFRRRVDKVHVGMNNLSHMLYTLQKEICFQGFFFCC